MPRNDLMLVGHILRYGSEAVEIASHTSEDVYAADPLHRYAIAYLVQIVGEAAWKLSDDFKLRHPEIPWPRIEGVRHRLVHEYFTIDYSLIWNIATHHLPKLIEELKAAPDDESIE